MADANIESYSGEILDVQKFVQFHNHARCGHRVVGHKGQLTKLPLYCFHCRIYAMCEEDVLADFSAVLVIPNGVNPCVVVFF